MQHHHLDTNGDVAPIPVEHLDLVTAELRRRIAGIGLAIAELREETGRLRASADGRYPAVALLDRPSTENEAHADLETVTPSLPGPAGAVAAPDAPIETRLTEPAPPWRDAPVAVVDTPSVVHLEAVPAPPVSDAGAAASKLTWVPEPERIITAAPASPADEDSVMAASALEDGELSLWGDEDDHDAAAFDAFFSAEIEPEPSQRWLLSD